MSTSQIPSKNTLPNPQSVGVGKYNITVEEDGILRVHVSGQLDEEAMNSLTEELRRILEKRSGKANILVDAIAGVEISSKARKIGARMAKWPRIGRIAIYGVGVVSKVLALFMIEISGKENMKFFENEEEALKWLRKKKHTAIIYGVDTGKPVTPVDVRDAVVECFTQAHKDVLEKQMSALTGVMAPEEVEKIKKLSIRKMIRDYFGEVGGDFEKPTKKSIIAVCDKLADFAKQYRSPEIIKEHYGEIMELVNKL